MLSSPSVVDVPHRPQYFVFGDDRICVPHQVLEHAVLARRQVHLDARSGHSVAGRIQLEIVDAQDGRPCGCAAAHKCPQPSNQHHKGEWLDQVVIRTEVECIGQVIFPRPSPTTSARGGPHLGLAQFAHNFVAAHRGNMMSRTSTSNPPPSASSSPTRPSPGQLHDEALGHQTATN